MLSCHLVAVCLHYNQAFERAGRGPLNAAASLVSIIKVFVDSAFHECV